MGSVGGLFLIVVCGKAGLNVGLAFAIYVGGLR
jgi:hypothetical protein